MRKFTSYGPIDADLHFHAPRNELIENIFNRLIGDAPEKGGHYVTIWAPRQTGKTWIMRQVTRKIEENDDFQVGLITLQSAKAKTSFSTERSAGR